MGRTVLVTGASGGLGPHLLAELLRDSENERIFVLIRPGCGLAMRARELFSVIGELSDECPRLDLARLQPIAADIRRDDLGLQAPERDMLHAHVDVVIHAAANTRFAAPMKDLREVNVEGTRHMLELARLCRRLQQFILVSTACVAGTRTGTILEELDPAASTFVNAYERTKWEAEQLVAAAALPIRIARLSTCIGGARTGYVHRFGAIHQSIRWLARGVVPMLPAVDGSRVDLLATDVASRWLARAAACPVERLDVCHVAAGAHAVPIHELVNAAVEHLRASVSGWAAGQIEAPVIVDAATFAFFERSVALSGDALFGRVLESAQAFFPTLLYPKVYSTAHAERLWGGPLPLSDWRSTLGNVIDFGVARDWRSRRQVRERAHV